MGERSDLRISLTTRCNYQCTYCRAESDLHPQVELPASDCFRLAKIFHKLGVRKIRLTGGEPLMRPDIVDIVRNLAELRALAPLELACTTISYGLGGSLNIGTSGSITVVFGWPQDRNQ
jgi:GTP 3',8-cyclase